MKKNQKWQLPLLLAVILITFYNILPTLFYYTKPLRNPIDKEQAQKIATSIVKRVHTLEEESVDWIGSFCELIHVKPLYIKIQADHPQWVEVSFAKSEEAARLRSHLPRAGSLIPFVPAKLALAPQEEASKKVLIQRFIPARISTDSFGFAAKGDSFYRTLILDRAAQIAIGLGVAPHFNSSDKSDCLNVGWRNPLFQELIVDWSKERIDLKLKTEKNPTSQAVIDEIAKLSRQTNEKIESTENGFFIPFHLLSRASGFLALQIKPLAKNQIEDMRQLVKTQWHPKHPDLACLPLVNGSEYEALPIEQKTLCILFLSPGDPNPMGELQNPSLYVVAKGIERILSQYESFPDSPAALQLNDDIRKLAHLLGSHGFLGFQSQEGALAGNFIFECADYARFLIAATREDFSIRGTQSYALLEVSDVEQRLLMENKIEGKIHEDLLKWEDEYQTAQVNPHTANWDVPKPTRSVFWNNCLLSARKFVRGDERKVLHWGLDLSGGKTIQIELRDLTGELVTGEAELKQGINELYQRVNKMGVSEVVIRQVGHHIVLDFPGAQAFSASELIKSSTMQFHVVNEKFSLLNDEFGEVTNRFLQEVWNHAVVTGKKDAVSLQKIAFKHLDSETGKTLVSHGLQLKDPADHSISSTLDDTFSQIAIMRGDNPKEWGGQSHPLLIVFSNPAMDGSKLSNIRASYDPSKGNFLSFEIDPSSSIYAWSSRYCKENILGTFLEKYSKGQGWRMAVILNGSVINHPTLNEPLQNSAMISGNFSLREVNQLAADLKAGSLTFTPHILFEKNVSPELGKTDRMQGIMATFVALVLVIASMMVYYRFSGLIASIAVLFNLLILWATLQNLGASLSLAGIAGIILTVGMAVDANVLVFERIKEEFAHSGNIRFALNAGYEKAYSAILDSNVTTVIAAIILLNFDSGPIKSFAINLIIGIASSMFTALFMTRFYFNRWVEHPKNTSLKMANWIRSTSFNFLKWAKPSFAIATAIIVIGSFFIVTHRANIFGMDFTGGYSLYLELEPTKEKRELDAVKEALIQGGITDHDFQLRELTPSHHLRLLLGTSMEQKGKPFAGMPIIGEEGTNPRIQWVVDTLQAQGLKIAPESVKNLPSNWTAMSGQMSTTMRNNALIGLALSFFCIFLYLAFRFEYKFAAAALICLFHDVFITLGLTGILHAFGVPLQIDLNTIAAIMTIVGYSLNDTIIIFDRIREEMHLKPHSSLSTIVNTALNVTLSRTTITSGTTLLVLLALVTLGGASIFSFALVMTIGVFFGTLSSWFIASPLMLYFHRKEEKSFALNR